MTARCALIWLKDAGDAAARPVAGAAREDWKGGVCSRGARS